MAALEVNDEAPWGKDDWNGADHNGSVADQDPPSFCTPICPAKWEANHAQKRLTRIMSHDMHETSWHSYGLFSICGQCNGLSYIIIRALPRTKRFWTQCQTVVAAAVRRGTCARMLLILYWRDHLGLPKCSTIGRRRMLERRDSEFSIWLKQLMTLLPKYEINVCYCSLFPEQLPAAGGFKFCEEIQRVTQRFSPCEVVGWKICPVKCQESSERKREVHLPLDCFPFWGSSAS